MHDFLFPIWIILNSENVDIQSVLCIFYVHDCQRWFIMVNAHGFAQCKRYSEQMFSFV